MGKTCHLPGTRNHLVGDAERLGRTTQQAPETIEPLMFRRAAVAESFKSLLHNARHDVAKGKKDGTTSKEVRVLDVAEIVWDMLPSASWQNVYERHSEAAGYSNNTARSRSRNIAAIRKELHEVQRDLLLAPYEGFDEVTHETAHPPYSDITGYVFEEGYVKIDNRTMGLRIGSHDEDNRDLLLADIQMINVLLGYAGVKTDVRLDDINLNVPLVDGPIPARKDQGTVLPRIPRYEFGFEPMQIF